MVRWPRFLSWAARRLSDRPFSAAGNDEKAPSSPTPGGEPQRIRFWVLVPLVAVFALILGCYAGALYWHEQVEITTCVEADTIRLAELQASASSPDLARSLAEVGDLLLQPVRDVRALVFDLSPPILYELGFEAALEGLLERTQDKYALRCVLENDGKPKPLDDTVGIIVFRAVQELLVNVVKHARAKVVNVAVSRAEDGSVCVRVQDDGVGFDPDAVHTDGTCGFGLFNIRERLRDVGGRLGLESEPGRGTCAVLTVPTARKGKGAPRRKPR